QMASVYATIANGGVRVAPNLIAGTVGADDRFTPAPAPQQRRVPERGEVARVVAGTGAEHRVGGRAAGALREVLGVRGWGHGPAL
ncbi:cell division protein, partial [Actinomadura montaniterrae]